MSEAKMEAVENVKIDDSDTFKYVLIKLHLGDLSKFIVRGFAWAEYHADIYEAEQQSIEALGVETECMGGGRIKHNADDNTILVYGYSMGYGRADHSIAVKLLKEKYPEYTKISFSNEGY